MKKIFVFSIVLVLIVGIVVLFYTKKPPKVEKSAIEAEQKILYWTCGMHPSVKSDKPGNCPICNMPLVPVYEESQTPKEEQVVTSEENETFYYGCGVKEEGHCPRCDEGNPDANCICGGHSFIIEGKALTKCPVCGRPLKRIEKYEEEAPISEKADESAISRVKLNEQQQKLAGIKTTATTRHHLTKQIRTVGKIAFDPELAVAQEEFLTAVQTRQKVEMSPDTDVIERADNLVEKSRFKLRLLGMSDEEIDDLEIQGKTQLNLVLPQDKAWVYADVYEYELSWVKEGQDVLIIATAYPGEEFKGIIKSISPVINPMTRSATVRIEADNTQNKLKPQMYVDVIIESMFIGKDGSHEVLAIPRDAVLDTGTRKIVYVDKGKGEFLGKEIKIGPEVITTVDGQRIRMYPVIWGLKEDEMVVTRANFLIDSQSQLTGGAAAAYGGALETKEEESKPPVHQH